MGLDRGVMGRGDGAGKARRLVFNPRQQKSAENAPLFSPRNLPHQTDFFTAGKTRFALSVFFLHISELSKLQMLGLKEKSDSSVPSGFFVWDKISWFCLCVTPLWGSLFSWGRKYRLINFQQDSCVRESP